MLTVITDLLRDDLDEGRVGVPRWLGAVDRQHDLASNYDGGPDEDHGQALYPPESTAFLSVGAGLGT